MWGRIFSTCGRTRTGQCDILHPQRRRHCGRCGDIDDRAGQLREGIDTHGTDVRPDRIAAGPVKGSAGVGFAGCLFCRCEAWTRQDKLTRTLEMVVVLASGCMKGSMQRKFVGGPLRPPAVASPVVSCLTLPHRCSAAGACAPSGVCARAPPLMPDAARPHASMGGALSPEAICISTCHFSILVSRACAWIDDPSGAWAAPRLRGGPTLCPREGFE